MSAFTAEQEKVLKGWTQRYPASIMGLVEALRQVQGWHRCVTDEDEEYLARLFDVPRVRIHEAATFFPSFTQKPTGRHRIGICRGLSCSLAGSQKMCSCLEKKLGIVQSCFRLRRLYPVLQGVHKKLTNRAALGAIGKSFCEPIREARVRACRCF